MKEKFSEKLSLLAIGTAMSISLSLGAYLISSFFGSYTSQAAFIKYKAESSANLKAIKENQEDIKKDVREIKLFLLKGVQ